MLHGTCLIVSHTRIVKADAWVVSETAMEFAGAEAWLAACLGGQVVELLRSYGAPAELVSEASWVVSAAWVVCSEEFWEVSVV